MIEESPLNPRRQVCSSDSFPVERRNGQAAGKKKLGSESTRPNYIDTTLRTIHCPLKCESWAFSWVSSAPEEGCFARAQNSFAWGPN